jgi:hypothetical protein
MPEPSKNKTFKAVLRLPKNTNSAPLRATWPS